MIEAHKKFWSNTHHRITMVFKRTMHCTYRRTSPDVNLTLVSWLTGDPVSEVYFYPKRGFVISEGRLRHHSGPVKCVASREEDGEETLTFRLVFSFSSGEGGEDGDGNGDGQGSWSLPTPIIDQFEVGIDRRDYT